MILKNDQVRRIMDRMSELEIEYNNTYSIDDKRVPRVTEIISAMLHEDYLMSWSNGLGFKKVGYRAFMREAADKGTYSHLAIERYIKNGYFNINEFVKEFNIVNNNIITTIESCLDGFKIWWGKINQLYNKVEVVFLEETMIHPYFGGTCDCLLKVDGEYWLVDFKTSNNMQYKYALQLAAYRFLLRELKDIKVNRLIVLKLDKKDHDYKTYRLNLKNKDHLDFINDCEQTFMLLTAAYKMRLYTTEEYYNVYKLNKKNNERK